MRTFLRTTMCIVLYLCSVQKNNAQITSLYSAFGYTTTCVDFYDESVGYVCGYDASTSYLKKSTNGGTVWSGPIAVSAVAPDLEYYFVKSLTANDVILIGENTFFGDPAIFRSSNAGASWTDVSPLFGAGLRDAYFTDALNGYAVGKNGTVLKTTDGGLTWTDRSVLAAQNFTCTYFIDNSTGFAASGSIVQRTNNGGVSWIADTITGLNATDFIFFNSSNGYMLSGNGDIYQTVDGGVSWSIRNKALYAGMYAMEKGPNGTILASGTSNICFQLPASSYWEKITGTSAFNATSLSFVNDSVAFLLSASTLKKIVIHTPSTYVPVVRFHTSVNPVCHNDPFTLMNDSKPGYSYRWYVNNVFQSSSYDFNYTFTSTGLYNIRLTAINPANTLSRDSVTTNYTISAPPVLNAFAVTAAANPVCAGTVPRIRINPSESGATYYIADSAGNPVSTLYNGTGSMLTISLANIYSTATFTIVAKKATACDTAVSAQSITLNVVPLANVATVIVPERPYVCMSESTSINIYNSEPGIIYRLKKNGVLTTDSLAGNGDTLRIPTHAVTSATSFVVIARNNLQCMRQFPADTVRVSQVNAGYAVVNQNLFSGDTLVLNNSLVTGDSLIWTFYPDASSYNDTSRNPVVSFSATGIKSSMLLIKTQYGCVDSLKQSIYVYDPAQYGNGGFCNAKEIPYRSGFANSKFNTVYDMAVDKHKNTWLTGYTATNYNFAFGFSPAAFIMKCDSNMNVQFEKTYITGGSTCNSVLANCIVADTNDNVFVGGKYFCNSLMLDTISMNSDKNTGEMFISKFDAAGNAKWVIRGAITNSTTLSAGGPSSLTIDDRGYIYCSIRKYNNNQVRFTFPDGSVYDDSNGYNNILILKIDPVSGSLIKAGSLYSDNGNIGADLQIAVATWYTYYSVPLDPVIKFSPDGKLHLVGTTYGRVIAGSHTTDTIFSVNGSGTYFSAIADTALNWENAFPLAGYKYGAHTWTDQEFREDLRPAFDVDSTGNLYFSYRWYRLPSVVNTVPSAELNGVSYYTSGNMLTKFSNNGTLLWADLNENPFISVRGISVENDQLILSGHFEKFFGYSSAAASFGQKAIGAKDIFMAGVDPATGQLDWARKYGSSTGYEKITNTFRPRTDRNIYIAGTIASGADFSIESNVIHNTMDNIIIGRFNPDSACYNDLSTGIDWHPVVVSRQDAAASLQATYSDSRINIRFSVTEPASVSIFIYDIMGKKIANLYENVQFQEGMHETAYVSDLSKGMYFVKLLIGNDQSITSKVILSY